MFKCVLGNHYSQLGESVVKVVLEKRPRTYETKVKVKNLNNPTGRDFTKVITSSGFETVREVNSCHKCAPKELTNE
jgi:hypothetical protein